MLISFKNDAWIKSEKKDSFRGVLRILRHHNSIERIDKPTTQLIFFSSFKDVTFRSYFEDSSRHFKTYNTGSSLFEFFSFEDQEKHLKDSNFYPFWFLSFFFKLFSLVVFGNILKFLVGSIFESHFKFRSKLLLFKTQDLVPVLVSSFKAMGLVEFSRLNVFIAQTNNLNHQYGVKFICDLINTPDFRSLLLKEGLTIPENAHFVSAIYNKNQNVFMFFPKIKDDTDNSFSYLLRKADLVESRIASLRFSPASTSPKENVLVFGRRSLTRGSHLDSAGIFLQSYDFDNDPDLSQLFRLLMLYVPNIVSEENKEALVVIEHNPKLVKELIIREEKLRSLLTGHYIAVACIDPSTKDIYALEGTQFVQQFFLPTQINDGRI